MEALRKINNAVILAGGKGTRLSELTTIIPKPLVEIGDVPILQHIINIFLNYGVKNIFIAAGYKKAYIDSYFLGLCIDFEKTGNVHEYRFNNYTVYVVDTGDESLTGERIRRLSKVVSEPFFMTYGDGVADIDLQKLEDEFFERLPIALVTAVHPIGRFGAMELSDDGVVENFGEKEDIAGWINGGFFVLSPAIFDFISLNNDNFEKDVLPILPRGQFVAYRHEGFWACIDTIRDVENLNSFYRARGAIWVEH